MPEGNMKAVGITSDTNRKLVATDDILPDAACGRLITASGLDAAGTFHTLLTDLLGRLQLASHTALTLSDRSEEIDPISQHYIGETLANVINGADATYYYYVDMAGFKHLGYQLALNCVAGTVTATVEATLQDDGTAPAACAYIDVTNAWFGVANLQAAAGAAAAYWAEENVAAKYVRVCIVAATGAGTGDWTIYHKRLY